MSAKRKGHDLDMPPPTRARVEGGGVAAEGEAGLEGPMMVKKLLAGLKHKITVNIEKRDLHADEALRFVDSEVDLDEELQEFRVLATMPGDFDTAVRLGTSATLMQLLIHDNLDIVGSVVKVLQELTDPALVEEEPDCIVLARDLVKQGVIPNILRVLQRLEDTAAISPDDSDDQEDSGLACLGIIENLIDVLPEEAFADDLHDATTRTAVAYIFRTLLNQKQRYNAMKGYCAEIVSTILQQYSKVAAGMTLFKVDREGLLKGDASDLVDGVRALVQCLAVYRKAREECTDDEIEYIENIFDCLCACLMHPAGQKAFDAAHGIALLLMLAVPKKKKKKQQSGNDKAADKAELQRKQLQRTLKHGCLKTLSHALQHNPLSCFTLLENDGLGVLCGYLMMTIKKKQGEQTSLEGYAVSVLHELLRYLDGNNLGRVVVKFSELDYQKSDRIVELLMGHRARLRKLEAEAAKRRATWNDAYQLTEQEEQQEKLAAEVTVTQLYTIIARLCAYSKRVHDHILAQLRLQKIDPDEILAALEELVDESDDDRTTSYLQNLLTQFKSRIGK
ncbi:Beta-catenin-like protein 1-like protein [Diplonema papillatum]|nr:Beta-catenin-like protein 1-like protein [Diplonema papillatum]